MTKASEMGTPAASPTAPQTPPQTPPQTAPTAPASGHLPGRWVATGAAVLAAVAAAALMLAWNTQQRVKALEIELVKRQQDSGSQATEARTLARQAEAVARESAAKTALLEARVAETSMQRSQFEDLIQSLARSRDENVLADIDAAIRVALQQAAITGSAEPLVMTLKQTEERLARYNQPRLERVRRAVAQDMERTRAAGVIDISVLTLRLDDVIRQVDDLPLLSAPERNPAARAPDPATAASASSSPPQPSSWAAVLGDRWQGFGLSLWEDVKSLVRVTRIDHPEAILMAPEQGYFLRENLKLRLLNARLALLSRQTDAARADLLNAGNWLGKYFDPTARKTQAARQLLVQVQGQLKNTELPRLDETLAALATAAAGR